MWVTVPLWCLFLTINNKTTNNKQQGWRIERDIKAVARVACFTQASGMASSIYGMGTG
jgi:hypothetical protein